MTRIPSGIAVCLLLALASLAEAKTVSIDFTGASSVSKGLTQVNNARDKDGATTIVQRGGKNVAMTGNTDASRYLYLKIDDAAFKQGLKTAWVTVDYFDEGLGGFKVDYDSQDDAHTVATLGDTNARAKFDTRVFTRQTWHLTRIKLQGGQEGGADLRIDDRGGDDPDGAEFIAKVTVSDEDPDFVHFPYAVNKITIDGVANPAEWAGAYTVTMDRAQFDGGNGANWTGPEDFSGTYSFKWDEEAFYIRGQVRDATPRLNSRDDGNYWAGDGMEQFLGLDDSETEINNGFTATDFKVLIGLGKTPRWAVDRRDGSGPTDFGDMKSNIGIVNTDRGYDFELRIPWSSLNNATVKPGQRIRWHMSANNSKVDPSEQQVYMSPSGRSDLNHKLSLWYRAMLDPKPAP